MHKNWSASDNMTDFALDLQTCAWWQKFGKYEYENTLYQWI